MQGEPQEPHPAPVICVALAGAFLFVITAASAFVPGAGGLVAAGIGAFGVTLLATLARRTRPSRTWAIVSAGLIIGAAAGVALVRHLSLQPRHAWNQWALFAIPVAGVCGSALGSSRWAVSIAEWLLSRQQGPS